MPVAKDNIKVGEALAYSRGQRVEADAVEANGWHDLVVADGSKDAAAIAAEITGRPVADSTKTNAPAKSAPAKQEG